MNILLTGASGGIGRVIKKHLLDNEINVISPNSKQLDLSEKIDVSQFPFVDGLIHCAGVTQLVNHSNIDIDNLHKIFQINTFSFVELCAKLNFNDGSNIIAIGSFYAENTKENRIQYSMSKHALYSAVKTIALEKSPKKIKVNMISPGFVDTQLTRNNNPPSRISELNNLIPLGLTEPEEIAKMCLFLTKNNNSITGQNLLIDGGYSLKHL